MKVGYRKPSLKRSIKARTTGRVKREIKKTVNPLYGKKGMGYVTNPKKAVYNKVYHKTTFGTNNLIRSASAATNSFQNNMGGNSNSQNSFQNNNPIAYSLITVFFGYLGIHKFLNGQIGMGLLYLFTMGLFGIGWTVDSIISIINAVNSNKKNKQNYISTVSPNVVYTAPPPSPQSNINAQILESIRVNGIDYDRKYLYKDISIVGMQYHGNIQLLNNERLTLKLEENNQYDSHAIMVFVTRNDMIHIGYIAKDLHCKEVIYDYLKRGDIVRAKVDNVIKCTMTIGLYKEAYNYDNFYSKQTPIKTFSVSFKDMYEDDFEIGDEVEYEYDSFEDKEFLNIGNEQKNIPKSIKDIADDYSNVMYITSLKETDTGVSVKISIYEKM